jgi:hypothetical protein
VDGGGVLPLWALAARPGQASPQATDIVIGREKAEPVAGKPDPAVNEGAGAHPVHGRLDPSSSHPRRGKTKVGGTLGGQQ